MKMIIRFIIKLMVSGVILSCSLQPCIATPPSDRIDTAKTGSLSFQIGKPAYIVATPKTNLENKFTTQLADYFTKVLRTPAKLVEQLSAVPRGLPVIMLSSASKKGMYITECSCKKG